MKPGRAIALLFAAFLVAYAATAVLLQNVRFP